MSAHRLVGRYGFALSDVLRGLPLADIGPLLAELDDAGAGAVWFGENVGGEAFATAGALLARSSQLVVAPGVANIAARTPAAMAAGRRILATAFPGRFALGIGVSHEAIVRAYGLEPPGPPLAWLAAYAGAMESQPGGCGDPPAPTLVAALGPRMLELTASLGYGVHAWNVTPEHTAAARAVVGPGVVLAPRQAVVLCADASTARQVGRAHLARYLAYPNYRRSWLRQGFGDEDLAGGGSDRLVDAMVAWGSADAITARLAALWDAGADHVVVHALAAPGGTAQTAITDALAFIGVK